MKKTALAIVALFAAPAMAQDIVVSPEKRSTAGYELLMAGRNADAVTLLKGEMSEPSRLINLGAAHARLGQTSEAAAAYRLAMFSDDRYDVELANGRSMDSRAAARMALARLNAGQTLLAAR